MHYSEFNFIEYIKAQQSLANPNLILGIGDDAALIKLNDEFSYVICTDTSALDAHFTKDTPIDAIGHKTLAVNLSDLAAMGAKPLFYLLNITRQNLSESWCEAFLSGLSQVANAYNVTCIGGDTTKGVDTITITAIGLVETSKALKRQGAQVGDLICVSGELGYGAFALYHPQYTSYQKYLYYPEPQLKLGQALCGRATAAIDISDGLLADLNHILQASQVGARLEAYQVPGVTQLTSLIGNQEALRFALTGGDDYQLCFTIAKSDLDTIQQDFPISVIGKITESRELVVVDEGGHTMQMSKLGFSHFE